MSKTTVSFHQVVDETFTAFSTCLPLSEPQTGGRCKQVVVVQMGSSSIKRL